MDEQILEKPNYLSLIISTMFLFLYFYAIKGVSDSQIVSNIVLYAGAIVVFMVIYCLMNLLTSRVKVNKVAERVLTFIVVLLSLLWIVSAFFEEIKPDVNFAYSYLRHNMPLLLYVIILVAAFFFVLAIIRKKTDTSLILRIAIGVMFVVIETFFLYAPAIFNDSLGGTFHATAYVNSIVNVLHKTPYEYWTTSIYGHYGLFYFIPIKLLQLLGINQWIAITTSIAFFGGICFMAETLLIHKLIKNDSFYVLTVVANALINTQIYRGIYWQVNPHRLLFPALILLLSYYYYETDNKNKEKKYLIFLWILSSLSIVWNFECGIICVLVCFLVCIYKQCVKVNKIELGIIVKNIGIVVLVGFVAFLIVNIYNKFCGGGWVSIKEYIYPIGSTEYKIEKLRLPLGTPFMAHFLVLVLFLGVICCYIRKIFLLRVDTIELMQTLASILGLGILTYYMNRVVNSNMSISAFEVTLVLATLLDKNVNVIQKVGNNMKHIEFSHGLYVIGTFVLTSMCISTIGSIAPTISIYYESNYNTEDFEEIIKTLDSAIPEDGRIAFIGGGASVFSSLLNRDKGIYMIDCEDMNPQGEEYLRSELATYKWDYIYTDIGGIQYLPDGYGQIFEYFDYFLYAKQ